MAETKTTTTKKRPATGVKAKTPASSSTDISALKKRRRKTEYGQQLEEKQTAKKIYGIRERQFRNYYQKAIHQQGDTGDILRQLLQMRLDNVIYQAGFTKSIAQARQLVNHYFFLVNGKKVNIPSYQVKIKDTITIKPGKEKTKVFNEESEQRLKDHHAPSWLVLDAKVKSVKVVAKPAEQELDQSFNPRLIVEFYSR